MQFNEEMIFHWEEKIIGILVQQRGFVPMSLLRDHCCAGRDEFDRFMHMAWRLIDRGVIAVNWDCNLGLSPRCCYPEGDGMVDKIRTELLLKFFEDVKDETDFSDSFSLEQLYARMKQSYPEWNMIVFADVVMNCINREIILVEDSFSEKLLFAQGVHFFC